MSLAVLLVDLSVADYSACRCSTQRISMGEESLGSRRRVTNIGVSFAHEIATASRCRVAGKSTVHRTRCGYVRTGKVSIIISPMCRIRCGPFGFGVQCGTAVVNCTNVCRRGPTNISTAGSCAHRRVRGCGLLASPSFPRCLCSGSGSNSACCVGYNGAPTSMGPSSGGGISVPVFGELGGGFGGGF